MRALKWFRLDAAIPAAFILAGSLTFLVGGRAHPRVNPTTMPPAGTPEYHRHFAEMMLAMPDWQFIHTLLLMGPLLWALGAAGAVRLLPLRARAIGAIARAAFLAGATLWALAFVLDGYVAPRYAQAVMSARPPGDAGAIAAFAINAFTMARIGLVTVVLLAVGIAGFSAALLFEVRARSWRIVVAVTGLMVGAWPVIAAAQGEFSPGPFVSVHWTMTALSFGVWFLMLATTLPTLLTGDGFYLDHGRQERSVAQLGG